MYQFFFLILLLISTTPSFAQGVTIPEKQLQKSILAFEKGQIAKAERLLDKLIAQEGSYAPAYVWKAKCLQKFEEYQPAYEAYYTACQLEPQVASHWLALADFKSSLGSLAIQKPAACGECGKQFLPLQEERPTAAAYFASALEDYKKAIALDKQLAVAHYQLGLTHAALGASEQACSAMQEAQKLGYKAASDYQKEHCTK